MNRFNENALLKPYIDINTFRRKKFEKWFWKGFLKVDEKIFGKNMENVRKHRDIKLYHSRNNNEQLSEKNKLLCFKVCHRNFVSNRSEKRTQILIKKPSCSGLSILELSKVLVHQFWCCMDTGKSQFQCIHKNRWYLEGYCRRRWN